MSKKSMADRRQMRAATAEGRAGSQRASSRSSSKSRGYRRQEAQRPWGLIGAVVAVVAIFVIVVLVLENMGLKQDTQVLPAPASLIKTATSIPVSSLDTVAGGSVDNPPVVIPASVKAKALSSAGLPEVAFVGGEFCPYCALQRWSLVVALSRFGTWHDLHLIRSSIYDSPANLPTFTFAYGATYKSRYFVFYGREYENNITKTEGPPYGRFQSLSPDVFTAFSEIGGGSYPFIDYAGRYAQIGAEAAPSNVNALSGLSWDQVAAQLKNIHSTIAQEVLGGANYVTAAICQLTGQKPGAVCSSSVIKSLQANIASTQ